tara:strand:+ start:132 stop:452 length:321 start_codon:yes stop_codon:yes gene_type:complete
MQLLEQYFNELNNGRKIKYSNEFFITYEIIGDSLQIVDAFVVPEQRGTGLFKDIMKEIEKEAKELNCKYIDTSTEPQQTRSVMYQTKNGYKVKGIIENSLIFRKEL